MTEQNFDNIVGNSDAAIVAFTSAWCATCDRLERVLQEISAEMDKPVPMAKVDITESPSVAHQYGIMGIPTMVCFRNGRSVHQKTLSGGISKEKISRIIKQHLGV